MKPKVEKTREAMQGSHRRTTEWLWNRVDIAIDLHQQRVHRQVFDKSLQAKPEALTSTSQPSKPNVPATPAPGAAAGAPKGGTPPTSRGRRRRRKRRRRKARPETRTTSKFLAPLRLKAKAKVAKAERATVLHALLKAVIQLPDPLRPRTRAT